MLSEKITLLRHPSFTSFKTLETLSFFFGTSLAYQDLAAG